MVISGNTLPAVGKGHSEYRRNEPQDAIVQRQPPSKKQTIEYVFRADIDEDFSDSASANAAYQEHINPANLNAINRYIDTEIDSPFKPQRQGRLLDIYI